MTGADLPTDNRLGRNIGVGCFTFIIGFFSGGMIAVLLGKIASFFVRAPVCEGVPLCDWHVWMLSGGAVGAVTLPVLAIWRLRRADVRSDAALHESSNRG